MTLKLIARNCLGSANKLGARLDRHFAKTKPSDSEALFVVGLPRSGTTLAYELVVQAFRVAFFSKIFNYSFGMPNLTTRLLSGFMKNPHARFRSDYGNIPGFFTPAENHNFWRTWFSEDPQLGHYVAATSIHDDDVLNMNTVLGSIRSIAGLPFVFKDVYLSLSLDAVFRKIERSKVLVIHRERESVAASIFKKRAELGAQSPWWSIRPPYTDRILDRNLVEQVAFQCVRSEQLLERQLSNADPTRYRIVDYAALCESPRDFVKQMHEWLGPAFELRENSNIPQRFDNRPSVGFPGKIGEEYARHSELFLSDRERYIRLVETESMAGRLSHRSDSQGR